MQGKIPALYCDRPYSLNNSNLRRKAQWKKRAIHLIRMQVDTSVHIASKVRVHMEFYKDGTIRDIDNMIKPTLDMLVAAGVLKDDGLVEEFSAKWVYEGLPVKIVIERIGK